jgi:hypothetical protein
LPPFDPPIVSFLAVSLELSQPPPADQEEAGSDHAHREQADPDRFDPGGQDCGSRDGTGAGRGRQGQEGEPDHDWAGAVIIHLNTYNHFFSPDLTNPQNPAYIRNDRSRQWV